MNHWHQYAKDKSNGDHSSRNLFLHHGNLLTLGAAPDRQLGLDCTHTFEC